MRSTGASSIGVNTQKRPKEVKKYIHVHTCKHTCTLSLSLLSHSYTDTHTQRNTHTHTHTHTPTNKTTVSSEWPSFQPSLLHEKTQIASSWGGASFSALHALTTLCLCVWEFSVCACILWFHAWSALSPLWPVCGLRVDVFMHGWHVCSSFYRLYVQVRRVSEECTFSFHPTDTLKIVLWVCLSL